MRYFRLPPLYRSEMFSDISGIKTYNHNIPCTSS